MAKIIKMYAIWLHIKKGIYIDSISLVEKLRSSTAKLKSRSGPGIDKGFASDKPVPQAIPAHELRPHRHSLCQAVQNGNKCHLITG